MSSDLCITALNWPRFKTGEYVSDFEMIRDEVLSRIRSKSLDDLDFAGFYVDESDETVFQDVLLEVEQAFLTMLAEPRDVVIFHIPCDHCGEFSKVVLGGGTDGSESNDEFYKVATLEVFDIPFNDGSQVEMTEVQGGGEINDRDQDA